MSISMMKKEDRIILKGFLDCANSYRDDEICLKDEFLSMLCPQLTNLFEKNGLDTSSLEKTECSEKYYKFREKLVALFVGNGYGVLPKDQEAKIIINASEDRYINLVNSMDSFEEEVAHSFAGLVAINIINFDDYDEEESYIIEESIKPKTR